MPFGWLETSGRDGRTVCRRSSVDGASDTARGARRPRLPCPRAPRLRHGRPPGGPSPAPDGSSHAAACPAPTTGNPLATRRSDPLRGRVVPPYGRVEKARLLVVDDDPPITDPVATVARYEGWEAVTVNSGEEALRRAAAFRPDIVVLDVVPPDVDGFGVLDRPRGSRAMTGPWNDGDGQRQRLRPRGDPQRIRQVQDNLPADAAVHTPPGTRRRRVRVRLRRRRRRHRHRRPRRADTGRRRGARHPGRGPGAGVRPVPPGGRGPQPRPGRQRSQPRGRQVPGQGARRRHRAEHRGGRGRPSSRYGCRSTVPVPRCPGAGRVLRSGDMRARSRSGAGVRA